ncbi:MAG: L,D-transpeptidase catalytic domain [Syntrophus sp. PtaB.Bin001]|nr:MAG: L,D-transpeptidase catalytic domain [Syntrophus sp. PtaB.Bin001]
MKTLKIILALLVIAIASLVFFNFISGTPSAKIYDKRTLRPDSLVSLTSGYAVIVDKKAQKLFVYGYGENEQLQKVFETRCSTGKNQGNKLTSGDSRTPEGIFFPTKRFTKDQLTPIYGNLAYNLDFPNFLDKKIGRNGHNIWIHGTDKPLKPFQSNGCVVLDNNDILRLSEFIYLNKTPVIIVDSINWVSDEVTVSLKNEIEKAMKSWKRQMMDGIENTEDYIYVMHSAGDKMGSKQFVNLINQLKVLNRHFCLEPKDISILKQDDNAVILFDQVISVENNIFQGVYMKLFLEKQKNRWLAMKNTPESEPPVYLAQLSPPKASNVQSSISINDTVKIADKSTPNQQGHLSTAKSPAVVTLNERNKSIATTTIVQSPIQKPSDIKTEATTDEKAIQSLISKWSKSWESGNMSVYQDCYAKDFTNRHMDLKQWVKYKEGLGKRYKSIQITIQNIKVSVNAENNKGTATFTQKYRSSGKNASGIKELQLKKVAGAWKISRETMHN